MNSGNYKLTQNINEVDAMHEIWTNWLKRSKYGLSKYKRLRPRWWGLKKYFWALYRTIPYSVKLLKSGRQHFLLLLPCFLPYHREKYHYYQLPLSANGPSLVSPKFCPFVQTCDHTMPWCNLPAPTNKETIFFYTIYLFNCCLVNLLLHRYSFWHNSNRLVGCNRV